MPDFFLLRNDWKTRSCMQKPYPGVPLGDFFNFGPNLENLWGLEPANIYVRGAWRGGSPENHDQKLDPKWILMEFQCLIGPNCSLNHLPHTSRINHPNRKIDFPSKWEVQMINEMPAKRTFSPPWCGTIVRTKSDIFKPERAISINNQWMSVDNPWI